MRTLVLNKNWFPIKHVDWKKAFTLMCKGSAEVVDSYDTIVRSPRDYYFIPSVIRLINYSGIPKARVSYSKRSLLERDEYTCQYCGIKLTFGTATVDHVIPRFHGGQSTFENTVTACHKCNKRKGSKTLAEARLKLLKAPIEPRVISYKIFLPHKIDKSWLNYIPKGLLNGVQIND